MWLIDADMALRHKRKMSGADFGGEFWDEAVLVSDIMNASPVDAVEVVRCKDCVYSYEEFGFIHCTFGPYGDCKVPSQFYCAEGKRKRSAHGVE